MIVAYVRISHDERGRSKSPDNQRDQIALELARQGFAARDVTWIVDRGKSGFTERRKGWQTVLKLIRKGKVSMLVATDLSRLHRRLRHALAFYEDVLVPGKVRLVLVYDRVDTATPEGKASYVQTANFNELYRNVISRKTRAVVLAKQSRGEKTGGNVPYGFDNVGGKLVVNKRERDVLAYILCLAAQGEGPTAIASRLTELGIRTKNGHACWKPTTVARLVRSAYASFISDRSHVVRYPSD